MWCSKQIVSGSKPCLDNNQHGANENLRLQNLWDGIEVLAGIMAGAEKNWK
jgi:acetylornithine deacetylase/succinyl-diaminopimelate desuccinylase-like protein